MATVDISAKLYELIQVTESRIAELQKESSKIERRSSAGGGQVSNDDRHQHSRTT